MSASQQPPSPPLSRLLLHAPLLLLQRDGRTEHDLVELSSSADTGPQPQRQQQPSGARGRAAGQWRGQRGRGRLRQPPAAAVPPPPPPPCAPAAQPQHTPRQHRTGCKRQQHRGGAQAARPCCYWAAANGRRPRVDCTQPAHVHTPGGTSSLSCAAPVLPALVPLVYHLTLLSLCKSLAGSKPLNNKFFLSFPLLSLSCRSLSMLDFCPSCLLASMVSFRLPPLLIFLPPCFSPPLILPADPGSDRGRR